MTSPQQSQSRGSTKLSNSIYNILSALGRDADFLYSTVDRYIEDAQKDGRDNLAEIWRKIKQDKEKHLTKLRDCLEKEAKEENLST
jgi:hypothetical protein